MRPVLVAALLTASVVPWLFASNVLKLVADRRDVLLGRYSVARFSVLLAVTAVLWLVAYAVHGRPARRIRDVVFRTLSVLLSVGVAALVIEVAVRLGHEPRYVERRIEMEGEEPGSRMVGVVRHMPPHRFFRARYVDEPTTARTFPAATPGYGPVNVVLTADARGFRNRDELERYDILTIGDSFTEGSRVDDDDSWPELLERLSGRAVYNLGVGGANPFHYLTALLAYGVELHPETAIVMLYEANDFVTDADEEPDIEEILESSPVLGALTQALVRTFGPIRADAPLAGSEILSWMPVQVPQGRGAKGYVFRPKRLLQLRQSEAAFRDSPEWRTTRELLARTHTACSRRGIRFVLAYAPSKAHVVMPLVRDRVPHDKLRAYAALKKHGLPEPEAFAQELYARLESQERVVAAFAEEEGIGFISTTAALRKAVASGRQVYYTYDPHWTPLGQELVGHEIHRQLADAEAATRRP